MTVTTEPQSLARALVKKLGRDRAAELYHALAQVLGLPTSKAEPRGPRGTAVLEGSTTWSPREEVKEVSVRRPPPQVGRLAPCPSSSVRSFSPAGKRTGKRSRLRLHDQHRVLT